MKIRILTQNPLSIGFGGVEQQASKYIKCIREKDTKIDIDFFKWDELDFDILHIIGIHGGVNPYWIDSLKAKGVKIIVSPVFYVKPNNFLDYRRAIFYRIFSFVPFHVINWMKYLLRNADLILPNSQDEGIQIQKIFGLDNDNINTIYNGIDGNYNKEVDERAFKKKYNLNDYILSVSHIEPRKNHLALIKAFLHYIKEANTDIKLVMLGDYRGNYFSYHREVRYLLQENQNHILHIPDMKNTDPLFRSAYSGAKGHFLLSSLETPGLSNLEAGIFGVPLVIGDCKPVREYFKDFAHYINGKDQDEIIDAIKAVSSRKNQEQIDSIKSKYSWSKIGQELLLYYYEVRGKKK